MALWINFKKEVFSDLNIDFVRISQVFFEMIADLGASFIMIFSLLAVRKIDDILLKYNKKHIFLSSLAGVCIFTSQITFCLGLKTSEASFTAPWMLLNPNFVTIFAIILQLEEFEKFKILGLLLSIGGTISLIIFKYSESKLESSILPVIFLFSSSVSNAIGVIIWRLILAKSNISPTVVTCWGLTVATVFMIGAYMTEPFWWVEDKSTPEAAFWVSFVGCGDVLNCCFLVMLGYSVTNLTMAWATHRSSISIVALYTSARPIFTVILSFIIHSQSLKASIIPLTFFLIVLAGLLLSTYIKKKEKTIRKLRNRSIFKKHLLSSFTHKIECKSQKSSEKAKKNLILT